MALDYWVEFFEDLQNVRGRSNNTVLAYRRDLELYQDFADKNTDITRFYEFMKKKKLSTRSQARVISSLRTYLRFCEGKGKKCPDLRQLRPPKVKVSLPKVLSLDEFNRLFESCVVEDPIKSARNQLTLMMLFGLGCRVSELISLNLHDFNEVESWLKVVGKGGKERILPLTPQLLTQLKNYLVQVRPSLSQGDESSILINDRGHRPSRVDIWRWLAAWSAKAGFAETISPHQFRHGCATALLDAGVDLRSIQILLGHASIQTTQIYTTVTNSKLQKEVDEHHPLSQIKDL
jgi:integrase/recombinase XerD